MDFDLSKHALGCLERADLDLVVELVLQSGSIKGVAKAYGVSYPTMRNRLDRLIGHLQGALAGRPPDPVREALAKLVERGELTPSGAREVLAAMEDERR